MSALIKRLHQVQNRLAEICQASQRPAEEVRLVAVSKTKPVNMVRECYAAGQRHFGENYLQDAIAKIHDCQDLDDIEWHFIGPVQSNKTRSIAEHFNWCETVDRQKIAQRLSDQRPSTMLPLNVLIQVNISAESQKAGVSPEQIDDFADWIATLPGLQLRGLMCIAEATENQDQLQQQFQQMHQHWQRLAERYSTIDTLSMGMSQDMELAIASGSTEVRIGTDIFGRRD